jgi:dimethylamine monooxygenase subunit A
MAALSSGDGAAGAPYLPFAGGGFRLAMGLMPLSEPDWIEIDGEFADHLAEKRGLLATSHDAVFAVRPEADGPASELLALLAHHLPLHHPDHFRRAGASLANLVTGEIWDVARPVLHPLDLCGRLVQEDFCLLRRDGDRHILVGASLCAPARWKLADKIGRALIEIHAPVAGYRATLARPVDRLFDQLKPGRLVWRLNWGIVDSPARFQPVQSPAPAAITEAAAGERLWLRVERQTMRKLPQSEAVVFTIRTHVARLDRAIVAPDAAADLASALRSMPAEMQRYKQIAPFAPALIAWLEARR